MTAPHPLDRPAWSALNGLQAQFAITRPRARRLHPEVGIFAVAADGSAESLADLSGLIRDHGPAATVEVAEPPAIAGTEVAQRFALCQMVAQRPIEPPAADFPLVYLGDADGPEMLALATLTEPGPFFSRTHQLGDFVGVRLGGRLVAMAGERMRPEGFTEVSAVCTHPESRGRGYAASLMRHVASRIQERGETPFLHVFPTNTGAIRLYEALGFAVRREMTLTVLAPA